MINEQLITNKTRCMGCMQVKGTEIICPHCGFNHQTPPSPIALPYQTLLNNKFIVGRVLGKAGGFGITYLAWDSVLQTVVAIKEYFPRHLVTRVANHCQISLHNNRDKAIYIHGLRRFLQEARTLAQFSHSNVVRVREFFQQNNTAYLVMDYYKGISLDEFVQNKGGKLTESAAFSILLPILNGLREVHNKGFLHCDIKPSNIYLTKENTPILLDFGATRFSVTRESQQQSMVVTEGFAPFEQYLEDSPDSLGAWTDIYAYGATFYAVVTGIVPSNAINRYRKDDLVSPMQLIPTLTPQLNRAIMAALALDYTQRPQDVATLQSLLLNQQAMTLANTQPITNAQVIKQSTSALMQSNPVNNPDTNATQSITCLSCHAQNPIQENLPTLYCYRCGKAVLYHKETNKKFIYAGVAIIALLIAIGTGAILHLTNQMSLLSQQAPAQHLPKQIQLSTSAQHSHLTAQTNVPNQVNSQIDFDKLPPPPPVCRELPIDSLCPAGRGLPGKCRLINNEPVCVSMNN